MKQSSKRLFSMILALCFVVAALLVLFDLIEPTYGDLQNLKGVELSDQNFLTQEQHTVQQAETLLNEYKNDAAAQDELAVAMPSGPDLSGALAQIYGIAAVNNIAVAGINVAAAQVAPKQTPAGSGALTWSQVVKPKGSISFNLTASGNYENMKNFLKELESNVRIFDITSFSIQPITLNVKGVQVGQDLFNYSITAQTYYQLP